MAHKKRRLAEWRGEPFLSIWPTQIEGISSPILLGQANEGRGVHLPI